MIRSTSPAKQPSTEKANARWTILLTAGFFILLVVLTLAGQYQAAAGLWGGACGLLLWGRPHFWSVVGAVAGGVLLGQAIVVMLVLGRWQQVTPEDCACFVFLGSLLGAGSGQLVRHVRPAPRRTAGPAPKPHDGP